MLENKLEELKQKGAYSVMCIFGEDIGADDLDIPLEERSLKVVCSPVGYLGGAKALFVGTVKSFLEFDLSAEPKQVTNPPGDEVKENGWYCWATDVITPPLFKM